MIKSCKFAQRVASNHAHTQGGVVAKKDPKNHAEGTGKLLYPVRVWLDEHTYA
jgi:hypothetical protein